MTYIAFALAVLTQSSALFYWGGKLSKSVSLLEILIAKQDDRIRTLEMGFDKE